MIMNMGVMTRYFGQAPAQQATPSFKNNRARGKKNHKSHNRNSESSINSQETGHSYLDAPLTQAAMSMSQVSQPQFAGFSQVPLSQADIFQDTFNGDDGKSQGLFSQDVEKNFLASQASPSHPYSQPY